MVFWLIYLFVCLYISYVLSNSIAYKLRPFSFIFFFVVLVTPATVDIGSNTLAPSLFIFLYDLLLERNFSFRSLRPIIISLPSCLMVLGIIFFIRKRFF